MSLLFYLKPLWRQGVEYRVEKRRTKKRVKVYDIVETKPRFFEAKEVKQIWLAKEKALKARKDKQRREDEDILNILQFV